MRAPEKNCIGIYVRESRDDNGERYETIENQRDLLLDFAERYKLGRVYAVYTDDNVSGSAFERKGLSRLREDVLDAKINILLLKDLSRLGRNNAKTLQFLDFLEEYGIRVISSDGRYDSLCDNDMVGIETWANERYIRDISRKIRSSLRFKIQRGEYLGNAPFGYRKAAGEKNRLSPDSAEAEVVRLIYRLYRSGMGYTSIAAMLNEKGCMSPGLNGWNRISVRRILCSRVYIGDTVQGVSEKVSFKSKKTRRLPREDWVITEGTHAGIISEEEFLEVQRIRTDKGTGKVTACGSAHILSGLVRCGGCGSTMYTRKGADGPAYVCGNYFRNGKSACTSHFVYEGVMVRRICSELATVFDSCCRRELLDMLDARSRAEGAGEDVEEIRKQLSALRRQQELLYMDRLTERISEQLFCRMNRSMEDRLKALEAELSRLDLKTTENSGMDEIIAEAEEELKSGRLTSELARLAVSGITVYDTEDLRRSRDIFEEDIQLDEGEGVILIDFVLNKRV